MKLFINDKPVTILNDQNQIDTAGYDVLLSGEDEITSKNLLGNVLIQKATTLQIERLLRLLRDKKLKKLFTVHFSVANYETVVHFIKDHFKIIKASGGVVRKGDKILMIYRLKKWDLPKGKLKKGEDPIKGGKREVEEECNIKVEVKEKLCSTYHTYTRKNRRILKKTNWYLMSCTDDSNMKPQLEEDIEDVRWMKKEEVQKSLKNSYLSIQEVIKQLDLHEQLNPVR